MLKNFKLPVIILFLLFSFAAFAQENDDNFLSYVVDPKTSTVSFYWKDNQGKIFGSIQNVKSFVENNGGVLEFAMNGGMYKQDHSPQGLFIERGLMSSPLDTLAGAGNFYLKPNGVFYLTKDNEVVVCPTAHFIDNGQIEFATQSGPMLLIDGEVHPAFKKGSANLNIRNGVGILPDGKILFSISKQEVNFYDFAMFFKNQNCKNALYLDGFVSRAYLPAQNWEQLEGDFAVIIGVVK
jgi:uncharacterized protein YigE (DUF2233 family)